MVGAEEKVTLRPVPWSAASAQALHGATGSDPTYSMADLAREVQTGTATLYSVEQAGQRLGFVVLWIDNFGGTRELVIQSGRAFSRERSAVARTLPVLELFARAHGCLSMRAHSNDGAMIGYLKRDGFHKAEVVMRKAWA